jgi:hypothetical protein
VSCPRGKAFSVARKKIRTSRVVIRVSAITLLLLGLGAGLFPVLNPDDIDVLAISHSSTNGEGGSASNQAAKQAKLEQAQLRYAKTSVKAAEVSYTKAHTDAQGTADGASAELAQRVQDAQQKAQQRAAEAEAQAKKAELKKAPASSELLIPVDCASYSGNRQIGCALLGWAGFGTEQMSCLDKLWTKESGWRVNARNSSGAYGIPQALPGSKMAAYGDDWQTNPEPQVKWGLQYIKGKYGTPCGAWGVFQSKGWY